jgi:O-palmitoleoyl-L-serine hydrolase
MQDKMDKDEVGPIVDVRHLMINKLFSFRHLMTSTTWTETREVGGILSPLASENPYWYNANHVFVPYCSSDSWSGSRSKPESRDSFRFMGSLIVRQVMADLIPLGLGHSQGADLLMAGSSAGGLGVMLNIDKVRTFLQEEKGERLVLKIDSKC